MKRYLGLVILALIVGVAIALGYVNRGPVPLTLDVFASGHPALSFNVPVYLVVFGCVLIGLALGGASTWFRQRKWRRAAKENRDLAKQWEMRTYEEQRKAHAVPRLSE